LSLLDRKVGQGLIVKKKTLARKFLFAKISERAAKLSIK